MPDIFIPTLHTFAMKNIFTGSWENFRFRICPQVEMLTSKEVDFANSAMLAQFWHGPFCYEKSTVEGEKTFPLTEEGRAEMKAWLEGNI